MQNCKTPEKIRHCDRSVGASVGGASGCGAADTGIQQQLLGKRNLRFTHRVKGGAFANSFSARLMCDASTLLLKKKRLLRRSGASQNQITVDSSLIF